MSYLTACVFFICVSAAFGQLNYPYGYAGHGRSAYQHYPSGMHINPYSPVANPGMAMPGYMPNSMQMNKNTNENSNTNVNINGASFRRSLHSPSNENSNSNVNNNVNINGNSEER